MSSPNNDAHILISAQDGPIRHGREIQERLQYFTVPILRFSGAAPYPDSVGSGVLVKIADAYFVLTAGHCVKGDFALTALGIKNRTHRFEFKPVNQNFINSAPRGDFGYFKFSSEQAAIIEAGNRVFLSERSVEVLSREEHDALGDFYALAGYPQATYDLTDEGTGSALMVYSSTLAGGPHAPASTLDRGDIARREIHMWIPQQGNVNSLTEEHAEVPLCDLQGASGGGWWALHMNRPEWQAKDATLIGTHRGSSPKPTTSDDGLLHKFSRVSLIGNHLALIARDFPDLRDHIYSTWPSVEDYPIEP